MEKIFYAAPAANIYAGVFGTLYDCAKFIARSEGHADGDIDFEDPLESLVNLLEDDPQPKYRLDDASMVLPELLAIEEAMGLKSLPEDLAVSEIPAWLETTTDNKVALREMAQALHARRRPTRLRGQVQDLVLTPFTPAVYDALIEQLT